MLAAAARVKESNFALRMEKAKLYPGISTDALAEREYDRSPANLFNTEAIFSWELDLWGKAPLGFTSKFSRLPANRGRTKGHANDLDRTSSPGLFRTASS